MVPSPRCDAIARLSVAARAQMAALTLLAVYDLAVTAATSYDEYARLHLEVDPLLFVVAIGSLLWLARRALPIRRGWAHARRRAAARQGDPERKALPAA